MTWRRCAQNWPSGRPPALQGCCLRCNLPRASMAMYRPRLPPRSARRWVSHWPTCTASSSSTRCSTRAGRAHGRARLHRPLLCAARGRRCAGGRVPAGRRRRGRNLGGRRVYGGAFALAWASAIPASRSMSAAGQPVRNALTYAHVAPDSLDDLFAARGRTTAATSGPTTTWAATSASSRRSAGAGAARGWSNTRLRAGCRRCARR
jgi:hypothetical protein